MPSNSKVVYSTSKDFQEENESEDAMTLGPKDQQLRVWRQRLGGGRLVTVVRGFVGKESDMKALGKMLKLSCSSGGTVKDGEILVQGDHREKIVNILKTKGYNAKPSGG
ncbi:MAG: translation initiation factor [Candidatus Marinimicrobia bacterium]|nr:translation initiation factor [Candidatus Neomarinimicrobiota bacterium]MCH7764279.1 translation initiation factor [Candidatus Neomarinimicrobiota bacterium]